MAQIIEKEHAPVYRSLISTEVWKGAGLSIMGVSHKDSDTPCQDFHCTAEYQDIFITAIADGAGSAKHADKGAQLVATRSVELITKALTDTDSPPTTEEAWNELLSRVFNCICKEVRALAQNIHVEVRELSSTLILTVLGPTFSTAIHVGDGATVILTENNRIETLSYPEKSEYIEYRSSVVSDRAITKARFAFSNYAARSFASFTDGLQLLALTYPQWEPYEPFFAPLFAFLQSTEREETIRDNLEEFLTSPKIQSKSFDDITLVAGIKANETN